MSSIAQGPFTFGFSPKSSETVCIAHCIKVRFEVIQYFSCKDDISVKPIATSIFSCCHVSHGHFDLLVRRSDNCPSACNLRTRPFAEWHGSRHNVKFYLCRMNIYISYFLLYSILHTIYYCTFNPCINYDARRGVNSDCKKAGQDGV